MNNASPKRRALYYVLLSSGMRLGEALSLTKKNIFMDETPVRIKIEADNTKTKTGRDVFISAEAVEKLKPILDGITDKDKKFFIYSNNLAYCVANEDRCFHHLREKLGMTEKYPNSVRYVVQIHAFQSWFHTKASQRHGSSYGHALIGHGEYLGEYFRLTLEEKSKKYLKLQPELLIESIKVEADQVKDKIIEKMGMDMEKMKAQMKRLELLAE